MPHEIVHRAPRLHLLSCRRFAIGVLIAGCMDPYDTSRGNRPLSTASTSSLGGAIARSTAPRVSEGAGNTPTFDAAGGGDGPMTLHVSGGDGPMTLHVSGGDGPMTLRVSEGGNDAASGGVGSTNLGGSSSGGFPRSAGATGEPSASGGTTPSGRATNTDITADGGALVKSATTAEVAGGVTAGSIADAGTSGAESSTIGPCILDESMLDDCWLE